jgi:hypothetical protein
LQNFWKITYFSLFCKIFLNFAIRKNGLIFFNCLLSISYDTIIHCARSWIWSLFGRTDLLCYCKLYFWIALFLVIL